MIIKSSLLPFLIAEVIPPSGNFTSSDGVTRETYRIVKNIDTVELDFVVMGDWGGKNHKRTKNFRNL